MAKQHTTESKLSFFDAMRQEINGQPVCAMAKPAFEEWLEQRITRSEKPETLISRLASHDYYFLTDRWHAMLILAESDLTG